MDRIKGFIPGVFEVSDYFESRATDQEKESGSDLADFILLNNWRPENEGNEANEPPQKEFISEVKPYLEGLHFENGLLINGDRYPADWDLIGSYTDDPAETTLDFRAPKKTEAGLGNQEKGIYPYGLNEAEFTSLSQNLIGNNHKAIKKIFRYEVHFLLKGIYYQEGLLFFDFWLDNKSAIPFETKAPEFQIRDKKAGKRSSDRLVKIDPHFSTLSPGSSVTVQSPQGLVLAFPVFTIAENKKLWIHMGEEKGDRELRISLSGKKLLKAEKLPMFH